MKVLILSCHTGEGHNRAAAAIQREMEAQNIACEIRDPVGFQSDRAKKLVADLYNNMIRTTPKSFGKIYHLGKWYSDKKFPSPVYYANARYAEALHEYIREQKIDAVVCTHIYGMEAMTAIANRYGDRVPSFGVMTDYTVIPFMKDVRMDGYFIPHESLRSQLSVCMAPESSVFVTGIPVDTRFSSPVSMAEARKELNLPQDKKIVMIMTGGVGCGDPKVLCENFLQTADDRFCACFLAGRNEKLRQTVEEKYGAGGKIRAVGFTDQVNIYMKASDVLITKAGGLSSTEAAAANIPLVHMYPIPGCETENARLFMENGMSYWAKDPEEAVREACRLAVDTEAAEKMREAQRRQINPMAARDIVQKVMEYVG